MRWFCNYCKEEHDSCDPSLFPPETFPQQYIAKTSALLDEIEVQPNTGWFDEDGEWKDRYREVNGQTYDTLADKRGPGESRVAYHKGQPIASVTWIDTPDQTLIGTAYTHPDYRGQGLFDHLTQDVRAAGKPVDAVRWHNRGLERHVQKWAGAPTKPPNLRQGTPSKNCLACKMYHKNKGGRGKCWGYGEYDVRGDQLCDSFEKETRGILKAFGAEIEDPIPPQVGYRYHTPKMEGEVARQGFEPTDPRPSIKNPLGPGVYFYDYDPRNPPGDVVFPNTPHGHHNLYEIDLRGLEHELTPDYELERAWHHPGPIPPERIRHLGGILAHNLQYDRDQHPEGKGFVLDDGSVWTWPTENLKPMHMQYNMKVKQQGQRVVPGSAFHIKDGKVWQYGEGRSLTPDQQQQIFAADPTLEMAPSRRQEELDTTPGFGHGQNVLDILERQSAWTFSATNIPEIARRIYEKAIEGVGSTINLHGETPHTRYGFAPDKATETPIAPEEFSPQAVEHFIVHWGDRLRDPEKYVGSWVRDDGMIVLDVSEGHDDYTEALRRAQLGQQEAIWDGAREEAISVPPLDAQPAGVLQ